MSQNGALIMETATLSVELIPKVQLNRLLGRMWQERFAAVPGIATLHGALRPIGITGLRRILLIPSVSVFPDPLL